jgi:hypothetical protein
MDLRFKQSGERKDTNKYVQTINPKRKNHFQHRKDAESAMNFVTVKQTNSYKVIFFLEHQFIYINQKIKKKNVIFPPPPTKATIKARNKKHRKQQEF